MKTNRTAFVLIALCLLLVPVTSARSADDPEKTQTVSAGGVTFQAPASWKAEKPASRMRIVQLKIKHAEGDKDDAELVVFAFPGGAGTVEANLKRWQDQFQDESGAAPKMVTEKRKGKNVDATFAEVAGRYVAAVSPGGSEKYDKPGYRLFGAIVETDQVGYFFKMVGPEKTMKAASANFNALIKSIEVESK